MVDIIAAKVKDTSMSNKRANTFYGYPIDRSGMLSTTIRLAPDRDLKRGDLYKIGDGGYGIAVNDIKAGECGRFFIEGSMFVFFTKEDDPPFAAGEIAGFDVKTGDLKKKDTPGTLPFYEVEEVFPVRKDLSGGMITAYFSQPDHP